jgi:hypothetical protein
MATAWLINRVCKFIEIKRSCILSGGRIFKVSADYVRNVLKSGMFQIGTSNGSNT